MYEYKTLFEKLLADDREVIVLPISSGLSATYQSAITAKKELNTDKIVVLDTKLVSMALGFQVLTVARAVEAGASLEECVAIAEKAYDLIGVYFTVDTLEFLHRGGRINTAKRLMGTALNLKPILEISDGKIEAVGSVRSQRKALDRMQQLIEKRIEGKSPLRISVFHAACPNWQRNIRPAWKKPGIRWRASSPTSAPSSAAMSARAQSAWPSWPVMLSNQFPQTHK